MVSAAMLAPRPRSRALAFSPAALGCLAVLAACGDPEALGSDDECLATGGGEGCALNQLQLRAAPRRGDLARQQAEAVGPCSEGWAQCGGRSREGVAWAGAGCCQEGYACVEESTWYSQCRPGKAKRSSTTEGSTSAAPGSLSTSAPAEGSTSSTSSDAAGEPTSTTTTTTLHMGCLCAFDIDRTLTVKQGEGGQCEGTRTVPGVVDWAYGGGELTLSALGSMGLVNTFCETCYVGIVTAGDASGPESQERSTLAQSFLNTSAPFRELLKSLGLPVTGLDWHLGEGGVAADTPLASPLVLKQPDMTKQLAVAAIVKWYNSKEIGFLPSEVHFFDDRADNTAPFATSGYNARQISCTTRDGLMNGIVGFCGAKLSEIVRKAGVETCEQQGFDPQGHWMYPPTTTTTTTTSTATGTATRSTAGSSGTSSSGEAGHGPEPSHHGHASRGGDPAA